MLASFLRALPGVSTGGPNGSIAPNEFRSNLATPAEAGRACPVLPCSVFVTLADSCEVLLVEPAAGIALPAGGADGGRRLLDLVEADFGLPRLLRTFAVDGRLPRVI